MAFTLTETHLEKLMAACCFAPPTGEMIFVGIRGCIPLDSGGTRFAAEQKLEYLGVDYLHLRCTFVQWRPGSGIAVFPGSTVPHQSAVSAAVPKRGRGVNQLSPGAYRDRHAYYRGDHKLSVPARRHRAFRNDSVLPVLRTRDDLDFDGEDEFDVTTVPNDNIHCAWQQDPAAASFSSNGCQVIVGRPRVLERGWNTELGPWARFVENAYALDQNRFPYLLFSGRQVLAMASGDGGTSLSVRFGSEGELVELVQDALIKHGFDVGRAGADGDCDLGTMAAIRLFQRQHFGADGVDMVVGRNTATALGLQWPDMGGATPPQIAAPATPTGPSQPPVRPASPGPDESVAKPDYRSLTPDGFFCDTPFDLTKRRSLRTNNPGALNITRWQRAFPGFADVTQPDHAGNRTTIYVTPEHGIAAWHHLMTDVYGIGKDGTVELTDLARRYAGVGQPDHPAVRSYVAGWTRHSPELTAKSRLKLSDDADMVRLGRGMFGHELGGTSPLKDDQIVTALRLKRGGKLPRS